MSDHAKSVRDGLEDLPHDFNCDVCDCSRRDRIAALDALVAERDRATLEVERLREISDSMTGPAKIVQLRAERDRYRDALAATRVPLDVARTHIEIIVRQGDNYTDAERAQVAQIAIDAIEEVRAALAEGSR